MIELIIAIVTSVIVCIVLILMSHFEDRKQQLKKQNKEMGLMIKEAKKLSRNLDREYNINPKTYSDMLYARKEYKKLKNSFRVNHIFLSLIRGKTRVQIESNFPTKDLDFYLEQGLKYLADKSGYNFKENAKKQVTGLQLLVVEELANVG